MFSPIWFNFSQFEHLKRKEKYLSKTGLFFSLSVEKEIINFIFYKSEFAIGETIDEFVIYVENEYPQANFCISWIDIAPGTWNFPIFDF